MSDVRPMSSIASRINRSFFFRLFWIFIRLDLLILLISALLFFYSGEKSALGESWQIQLERSFEYSTDSGLSLPDRIGSLSYTFALPGGSQGYTVDIGSFARPYFYGAVVLGSIQLLTLITQYIQGSRRTRYLLDPLRQMARTTEELSRVSFDEDRYHTLESAIDAISPLTPEARLNTGDRELAGLEFAVNNLLSRMHDSYRQQTRFVSDASHELRTPISVIQGYADLLARWGSKDEKVLNESISAIQSESRHMQKLVEQLLFLARGDSGRNEMNFQKLDLAELMREVRDEYSMIDEDHQWTLRENGPVPAYGDIAMLKQAVRILSDNASKYSPKDSEIILGASIDPNGASCFEVRDNGQGIPDDEIAHIFDRFYRADPARTRETGGTGLGLSIAKWIVDRHRGYFKVVSLEGVGTRITVHLPAPAEFPEEAETENKKAAPAELPAPPALSDEEDA